MPAADDDVQVYRYRFFILLIYSLNSAMTLLSSFQFSAVPNATRTFYDVSATQVYWTSMLYSVSSTLFTLSGSWLTEKKGIRLALVLCASFNCLGNGVKCASGDPNRFYVVLAGQAICSVSQIFVFVLPSRVAGEWFAAHEVSTASAVTIFAISIGVGLGLLVPTYVVVDRGQPDVIGKQFRTLQYGYFAASAAILIVTLLGARNKPPSPPSRAAALRLQNGPPSGYYLASIKRLLKNKNFDLQLVAFAFNMAVNFVFFTVLNDVGSKFFPNHLTEFGWLGFVLNILGCPASVFAGYLMDKTRRYKEVSVITYALFLIGIIALVGTFYVAPNVNYLYIPSVLIGIVIAAYLSIAFEFGTELSYPEIESTISGVLFTCAQAVILILIPITTFLGDTFQEKKDLALFGCMAVLLSIGLLCQVFVKPDYRRQFAEKSSTLEKKNEGIFTVL